MLGGGEVAIPVHNLTGSEPREDSCITKPFSDHFSICVNENWRCKYALLADFIGNYCIHPDHKKFQEKSF